MRSLEQNLQVYGHPRVASMTIGRWLRCDGSDAKNGVSMYFSTGNRSHAGHGISSSVRRRRRFGLTATPPWAAR